MEQNGITRNGLSAAGLLAGLPSPLREWLDSKQLILQPSSTELREMAKEDELPNAAGLAAYPVRRPVPPGVLLPKGPQRMFAPTPQLPVGVERALLRTLQQEALLVMRGRVWARTPRPQEATVVLPMSAARLALALDALLWPLEEGLAPATGHHALLMLPEPLRKRSGEVVVDAMAGIWPRHGLTLMIGYDDPSLFLPLVAGAGERPIGPDPELWRRPLLWEVPQPVQSLPLGSLIYGAVWDAAGELASGAGYCIPGEAP